MPKQHHFEPFVHLAGLTDDQALIAWGGFWFRSPDDGRAWSIVDDEELDSIDPGRVDSIGRRSQPYGHAVVDVYGPDGAKVASESTDEANHVWIRGLEPATEYRYEITVDGRAWVPDECRQWRSIDADRGELCPAGRTYDCRFRTFPEPGSATDLRAVALGDYGVGIQTGLAGGDHQQHVAGLLQRLCDDSRGIDLVITLGDNIYHVEGASAGGTGANDDDWYFSFYEPYRFVINRVPVYPSVGNHDAAETEASDDRMQLADNHFTDLRFIGEVEADRSSVEIEGDRTAGLFYRFSFGRLVEFVCIDTSEAGAFRAERFFDEPQHQPFLDEAFDPERSDRGRWLVPFGHHPPYCAGPSHQNDDDQIVSMVPRYQRAGVRVVLAGHEHNFQHSLAGGIHYLVCGAGGKVRTDAPTSIGAAHTHSWAATPHLLLIEADHEQLSLLPVADIDGDGRPVPLELHHVGDPDPLPIVIT